MKLSRLEIMGFKSFADKVTLNFGEGITAVVGPNGCGKSNIVDAIRWVMGEQSAKFLRGQAMEDVIFGGSEARGPMGLAEVSLTFKTDGRLPPEYAAYDEISIRRRLFRDGESEYAINKTPVRLKDVTDLFLGTGIGTRAYSIIEQGRIGFIVNAKPDERRTLIEEVAGVTKYKARKKQAERRMEQTEANLQRVSDVVNELGRQMGSLERQAKKAETYRALKGELRTLELRQAALKYLEWRSLYGFYAAQLSTLTEQAQDCERAQLIVETQLEGERLNHLTQGAAVSTLAEALHEYDTQFKLNEKEIELTTREKEQLHTLHERASGEIDALHHQKTTLDEELQGLYDQLEALNSAKAGEQQVLREHEERLALLKTQKIGREGEQERTRRELLQALAQISDARAKLESVESKRYELKRRRLVNQEEKYNVEMQRQSAAQERARLEQERTLLAEEMSTLQSRLAQTTQQLEESKAALKQAQAQLIQSKGAAAEKRSRLEALTLMDESLEGYQAGVQFLKQHLKTALLEGPLLADVMRVSQPQLEQALETWLNERLQTLLLEEPAHVVKALALLNDPQAGRAHVMVTSWCDAQTQAPAHPQPLDRAALDLLNGQWLVDHVEVDAAQRALVKELLQPLYFVESLETLLQEHPERLRTVPAGVTLIDAQGRLFSPPGLFVAGQVRQEGGEGLLKKKREIRALKEACEALALELSAREAAVSELEQQFAAYEQSAQSDGESLAQTRMKAAANSKDEAVNSQLTQQLSLKIESLAADDELIEEAFEGLEIDTSEHQSKMAQAQTLHSQKEAMVTLLQGQIETLWEDESALQQEITTVKVGYAQQEEKRLQMRRMQERIKQTLIEVEDKLERANRDIHNSQNSKQQLLERLHSKTAQRQQLLTDIERTQQALTEQRIILEQMAQQLRDQEAHAKALQKTFSGLKEALMQCEMKLSEAQIQLTHVQTQLYETHQLAMPEVLHEFHAMKPLVAEDSERMQTIKSQIQRLGEVNVMAIDEFKAVQSRFGFLNQQKSDLEEAIRQLKSAIMKINRASRERMREAFASTNEMFQKLFPRLFRGGAARLELIYPPGSEDILEAGVDIFAEPPGKKLQSVQLLSGGEKALTALALICAIFLIKPSPFCLLDEVDAPLDEGNVGRFNQLLQEMSKLSQFVVITHNKRTMEHASKLYGVTMQEPGISKMVSVNLTKEELATGAQTLFS